MKIKEHVMTRLMKSRTEHSAQAFTICQLGATDRDLAELFVIDERTINRRKKEKTEFCHSIKRGEKYFDNKVEMAIGYSPLEEKIFSHGVEILTKTNLLTSQLVFIGLTIESAKNGQPRWLQNPK